MNMFCVCFIVFLKPCSMQEHLVQVWCSWYCAFSNNRLETACRIGSLQPLKNAKPKIAGGRVDRVANFYKRLCEVSAGGKFFGKCHSCAMEDQSMYSRWIFVCIGCECKNWSNWQEHTFPTWWCVGRETVARLQNQRNLSIKSAFARSYCLDHAG